MMKAFTAIMLILLTACSMWLAGEVFELRKNNLALAIQMSGLGDRMNYQMQLIDKLQQAKSEQSGFRAEAKPFVMPENGTIEYAHPIYRIPEGNR